MVVSDLTPQEIAYKNNEISMSKTNRNKISVFILALFAGMFISFGGIFATIVSIESEQLPLGLSKFLGGIVFSVGLILVVTCGAELFTGNNLMIQAVLNKTISMKKFLGNLLIVYAGNFLGSIFIVASIFLSEIYQTNFALFGKKALDIATYKTSLTFIQALMLGILCNIVVCLAVWASLGAKTFGSKVAVIIPIISMFVAAGFEHCVANMYFLPMGWLIKIAAPENFWMMINQSAGDFSQLTWQTIIVNNLFPVTIGNMIGGILFVGVGYWFVYQIKD